MITTLDQAKNILSILSVHMHSPNDYAQIKDKPIILEKIIKRNYNLPFSLIIIDNDKNELVIGLTFEAECQGKMHEIALKEILQHIPFRLIYAKIIRDDAPSKKLDCRPLWGGVRMNGAPTLNIVYPIGNGINGTILSSHAVGLNGQTGQSVGQSAAAAPYGVVTKNPSLGNRLSDSALASITNRRITGEPHKIWAAPDLAYTVVDYLDSSTTPTGLQICMQGSMTDQLQTGLIIEKDVTIVDSRGTLKGQLYASYSAQGGDSGAPIFFKSLLPGLVFYVGIHTGRIQLLDGRYFSFYSPWESIRDELGLTQILPTMSKVSEKI